MVQKQIRDAVNSFYLKIRQLDMDTLEISDYNKHYLNRYIENYAFYMDIYSQLFKKAITKLPKPISDSSIVDYGGGCGILSYLARELGFKEIIYNDIYQISTADVKVISKALNLKIDYFLCGDVDNFVDEINKNNITPDLICSFDVIEHIYDLEKWFEAIVKINTDFSIFFMTHANTYNPLISRRLKKLHYVAEHEGVPRSAGWKEIDLNVSFLKEREKIIKKNFSTLKREEIILLAKSTRGLRKDDILSEVALYIKSGKLNYTPKDSTNTCDPYTGNWTEHLIDLKELKIFLETMNLKVEITNSYYSYSNNKIYNIPKYMLNAIIYVLGPKNLFLSPSYTLKIEKNIS